jgi:beta-N-acetylhexosaminidase
MTLGPLMIDVQGLQLAAEDSERLRDPLVGGVVLFTRNFRDREQLRALITDIHAVRTPPPLVAVDQEGGRVQRFREGFTALPPLRWLGAEHDVDADRARHLAFAHAWVMAAELVDVGVDFSFAPVVDLDWGVSEIIGDRALHRNPEVVASLALSYMQGMRAAGMASVGKHFPGHGAVVADSHLQLPEDPRPYLEIQDDITPYRRLIDHGLAGIMVAHVRYPQVDHRIASMSPLWMQRELRESCGFQGVIFSDDLNMAGAAVAGAVPERVRRALDAGADMALVCNNPEAVAATLEDLRGYQNPAGHARLVAMRAHAHRQPGPGLRASPDWQRASALLADALTHPVRPTLHLNG